MSKYVITFNQNADSIDVDFRIGGGVAPIPALLWDMGDAAVAAYEHLREPGYAVESVSQVDAQDSVPRPPA